MSSWRLLKLLRQRTEFVVATAGTGSQAFGAIRTAGTQLSRMRLPRVRAQGVMSRDQAVAGAVRRAGQLHALLLHEAGEQLVEQAHDLRVPCQLVRAVALDRLDAVFLDVAGDNAREGASQVRREQVNGLRTTQLEGAHALVRHLEMSLQLLAHGQQPVEVVRVVALAAELAHGIEPADHVPGYLRRIVDDDHEALQGLSPERRADEMADPLEIARARP